nr:protein phosphatase 2C domain-containing protein [Mycoplasmopsis bovis]
MLKLIEFIELNKVPFLEIETNGAKQILSKKDVNDRYKVITFFILPPSVEELKNRILNRNTENNDAINIRMQKAIDEINDQHLFKHKIVNDDAELGCQKSNSDNKGRNIKFMDFGRVSEKGTRRLENQDAVAILNNENCTVLLLCDGMGGHYGGAIASSTTVKVFKQRFDNNFPNSDENDSNIYIKWIRETISACKKEMTKIGDRDEAKLDMGTTVTGALVNSKYKFILIFNIGDSRTYILDNSDQITQATVDHNYLNQLISDGISEQEAKKSTNRFSLTSALGPTKNTRLDISTILSDDYNRVKAIISTKWWNS